MTRPIVKPSSDPATPRAGLPPSRRELRRDRIRSELVTAGLDLFKRKGYDATTISDIVESVAMSPRTFFRYFKSKDDLVFEWMDRQGEFVDPVLSARPRDETPLQAMEQTFLELADVHDDNREHTYFLTHLVFDTPSLSGRYHLEHAKWEDDFINVLQRSRAGTPEERFMLRVQVSTAITAFVTAIRSWAEAGDLQPLRPWVGAAFAALAGKPIKLPDTAKSGRKQTHRNPR